MSGMFMIGPFFYFSTLGWCLTRNFARFYRLVVARLLNIVGSNVENIEFGALPQSVGLAFMVRAILLSNPFPD
ncbi:hypothetical protein WS45_12240 [Burkholderia sp. RF2-non_BP3]|nr:hypothetical protein WS45_12240 [Burkholderia sp. RF2-non_BP3]